MEGLCFAPLAHETFGGLMVIVLVPLQEVSNGDGWGIDVVVATEIGRQTDSCASVAADHLLAILAVPLVERCS